MRTPEQTTSRLTLLHGMLHNAEVTLECSELPKRDRTRIRKIALCLALAIEQIEWVLGLRHGTAMDDYRGDDFPNFQV
jgi:hypothetical protein